MPPAQRGQSIETRKGTGISAFKFAAPFSRFIVDATKLANVGAPRPVNTLSNNKILPRTPSGIPPSSRPVPSDPPSAKRRRVGEGDTHPAHCQVTFAPIHTSPSPAPRKRSIGSVSITDSQRSVASNTSDSQRGVPEYRALNHHPESRRPRKRRTQYQKLGDVERSGLQAIQPSKGDEDITEDEVDLINPSTAADLRRPKRKRPEERPIEEFSDRFKGNGTLPCAVFEKAINNAEKKAEKGPNTQPPDRSPDELAPSADEIAASRAFKRQRIVSPSLSKRGHIAPTSFKGVSNSRSSAATDTDHQRIAKRKSEAGMIIGAGLRIIRGASGQCQYRSDHDDDPDHCFLCVREIGHTLSPVDHNQNLLKPYAYLTLNINAAQTIFRAKDSKECCIVAVKFQMMNLANSAGVRLMVEFASPPEFEKFFQWVALYKQDNCGVEIKDCSSEKLESDLNEMIRRAQFHRAVTDADTGAPVPDDIRVMQHNRKSQGKTDPCSTSNSRTGPKLRDAMTSSTSRFDVNNISPSQPLGDRQDSVRQKPRTTRSTFTYIESPEPEPEPPGWTSLNVGWERQWRSSLVYPDTGKNRATIDKEDIPRLDEGQFLNDNIIIFYLRYLQKNLEDTNENLAKRIYFQNTFFYDKLKPTKTGHGINYDSVKSWTSKVDLFSKDYIIVPINEHNHWYVAIICNAPKLLDTPADHVRVDDVKNGATTISNDDEITQESSKTPLSNRVANGHIDGDGVASPTQVNVVENLRHMSIGNSNIRNVEMQQKTASGGDRVDEPTTNFGREVYVIKDSDRPEAEADHAATAADAPTSILTNPQTRKKTVNRKCDPNQPRIITLDSLGTTHSPTCSYLRQYLVAELRDKRGIESTAPGPMGTTAKELPGQTNHCDCGLFLLGYIQEFLSSPDLFVKSLLQRDGKIEWRLDPSELRNNIRDLIFHLQKEQQKTEDAAREHIRQTKMRKSRTKVEEPSSHTPFVGASLPSAPSKLASTNQDRRGDGADQTRYTSALPDSQSLSSRRNSTTSEEATAPQTLPAISENAAGATTEMQPPTHYTRNDDPENPHREQMDDQSNVKRLPSRPHLGPKVPPSPRKIIPESDDQANNYIPDTNGGPPDRSQVTKRHLPSSETEGSPSILEKFLPPLASETPSSRSSQGVTPLDPVVIYDSDKNGQDVASPSLQRFEEAQPGRRFIVEIQSAETKSGYPRQDGKTNGRKETGRHSSYFGNRQVGEKVTAARLREKPQTDIIDLSDD